jgi:hemoglobin
VHIAYLAAMQPDISNRADIQAFVTLFYQKLANSTVVQHIFFDKLGTGDWAPHLERIVDFWETVLFGATTYTGQSFAPHASMQLQQDHFTEWLALFTQSIDELFVGPKADEAKQKANTMAILFMSKINYTRDNNLTNIL